MKCGSCGADVERGVRVGFLIQRLRAMARRDWAVRVLDAWAERDPFRRWTYRRGTTAPALVQLFDFVDERQHVEQFFKADSDAAREAAALAVFAELSADVRATIGERP
jgi:hypothetical protein